MPSKNSLESDLLSSSKTAKKYKLISLVLLVMVFIFSALDFFEVFHFRSVAEKKGELHEIKQYSLIDPARNMIDQDDAITNIQGLREKLNEIEVREKGTVKISLYFEFLNTGANISINQNERIFPASLAKLPLALLVMKKIEDGSWNWDLKLTAGDENLNSGSGELYKEGYGAQFEIKKLMEELLTNSDNTAYRILKNNTTLEERRELAEEIGLGDLFEDQGKVSAKEYSRLLRTLYVASYLNRENSQLILDLLSKNKFKEFLNLGMPENVLFAHKQGENVRLNVFADSGIVYLQNRPYIISVMVEFLTQTGKDGKSYSQEIFKEVSQEAYKFIKNQ
jgi:beta-lactamase class A